MPRPVLVHFLPSLFAPEDVEDGVAVIVDILRASTTITHALARGAYRIIPCATVEDAFAVRDTEKSRPVLLGGERGGKKIDGFDLSNSPDDYSANVVSGKTIGFTTTNGTKAILRCRQAELSVIGCFANLTATLSLLESCESPVHVVCAGTDGVISGEDVLFAGAVVDRLETGGTPRALNDSAQIAHKFWQSSGGSTDLEHALRESLGGRNLIQLGYDVDIKTAAEIDSVSVVGFATSDGITTLNPDHT